MWLLEQEAFRKLNAAIVSGEFTAEQIEACKIQTLERGPLGGAEIRGSEGVIPIEGTLTEKFDFFAHYFGGGNTLYGNISAAVEAFDKDPSVNSIVFEIGSSPGGHISGLFAAVETIQKAKTPTVARVKSMAASATYALASAADKIYASDKSTMVGSVGVVQDFCVDDSSIQIRSTKAPKKNPDVRTEEGKAAVTEVLDGVHELFAGAIAKGRGTTTARVNADFGQGAIVLASDAVKKEMIDGVGIKNLRKIKPTATSLTKASSKMEVVKMNKDTLRLEHPALYAEMIELGVAQERDRVIAHVKMGEASGDTKTMMAALKDGSGMTMTIEADYKIAAMRRNDMDSRQEENPDLEVTAAGDGTGGGADPHDIVANNVAEMMGLDDLEDLEV